ncbi:MAG TPA: 30S ribosomal protein S6--L-glutamate ligase [Gammaproteobacteria bacterium]|jgi:ribosomal protein S6--L-glutamate ligase|nr:30S ribosomal protein S6--L-glutamate ligase [Gammaproteobacteria bacterium]
MKKKKKKKPGRLKIAILSRNTRLYSTKRLVEAGIKRGHDMYVIDPLRCYMNLATDNPEIHFKGRKLAGFDAIIPRIGASVTFYATAMLRQFEMTGVFTLNDSDSIMRARDKLRSLQLLSRAGIGLPVTGFAHAPDDTEDLMTLVGDTPVIIKLTEGSQGQGVVLAETRQAAESVIDAFRGLNAHFMVQRFVKEAQGADIRCFVVGGKVVAAMKRQARRGEFRANLHKGGSAEEVKVSPQERDMALMAAEIIGLNVAGVDIIRSAQGPLILEVNSSPGLEGIEAATRKDIAGEIIGFIEGHARKYRIPKGARNGKNA